MIVTHPQFEGQYNTGNYRRWPKPMRDYCAQVVGVLIDGRGSINPAGGDIAAHPRFAEFGFDEYVQPEPEPYEPPPAEVKRQEDLEDTQAQYAAYCLALGFDHPVDMDELSAALEGIGGADTVTATRLGLTMSGLVSRMQRLARDPAALELILPRDGD